MRKFVVIVPTEGGAYRTDLTEVEFIDDDCWVSSNYQITLLVREWAKTAKLGDEYTDSFNCPWIFCLSAE